MGLGLGLGVGVGVGFGVGLGLGLELRGREAPALMKKTPRRIPSKGRMSAWICAR